MDHQKKGRSSTKSHGNRFEDNEQPDLSLSLQLFSSKPRNPPLPESPLQQQRPPFTLSPPYILHPFLISVHPFSPIRPNQGSATPPTPPIGNSTSAPSANGNDGFKEAPTNVMEEEMFASTSSKPKKSVLIQAPYPWAKNRRAAIYSLKQLIAMGIHTIKGEVHCNKCDATMVVGYDLEVKFLEVASFVTKQKHIMHDRAPGEWHSPIYQDCTKCKHPKSLKPVISNKKRRINWLFMLLGQTLGQCTLEELKYCCKHGKRHRTGAKDRVLYHAYLCLLKQLDPNGPFN